MRTRSLNSDHSRVSPRISTAAGILSDTYSIRILLRCSDMPSEIAEIAELLDIPIAVAYRRVHELEGAGVLKVVDRRLGEGQKWSNVYGSQFSSVRLSVGENRIKTDIRRAGARTRSVQTIRLEDDEADRYLTFDRRHLYALPDIGLETLLRATLDGYNLEMLCGLSTDKGASIETMRTQLEIPIAVAYRRVNDLRRLGLLHKSGTMKKKDSDRTPTLYTNNIISLNVALVPDRLNIDLKYLNGASTKDMQRHYTLHGVQRGDASCLDLIGVL